MVTSFTCASSPGLQVNAYIILFLCCSLFFFPLSESVSFDILEFDADTPNMVYSGDWVPNSGDVGGIGVGHVKYAHPVQIWDSKSGKLADFKTQFTFIIDTRGQQSIDGDGFAFFLVPVSFKYANESNGSYLGLFSTTTDGSIGSQMIAFEFDPFVNDWDPPYPHVGINGNSVRSAKSVKWNASFHSGRSADASISYNATIQILSLSFRYPSEAISRTASLSHPVDLREALPEWVTIGFSGGGSSYGQRNILRYWKFNSNLNITTETYKRETYKRKLAVGLSITLGVIVVSGILVACIVFRSRQRKVLTREPLETVAISSINDDLEGAGPRRFSYRDLTLATNNFSDDQKLGEGGFGCVYKGYLSRKGMAVAVKKISQGSKQGKKEYLAEVKIISILRHRNLVQLIGWCHDQTRFLLVYEFLPNGSLDSHLFRKKTTLEWAVRYKIALGLASALFYLHEECEQCVVHRDIKTSNILLDSGFNVKLGDFGLARLMDHELGLRTTGLAGTIGYMAPEYTITGKASKESDVYSFGVVALEIACGRKATDIVDTDSDLGLVQWVWGLVGKHELLSGVDQMLNNKFDTKQVECLMLVGLWCAHPDRSMRPSIQQAIQMLKFEGAVPKLPEVMPVPTIMYFAAPPPPHAPEICSAGATMTTASIHLPR